MYVLDINVSESREVNLSSKKAGSTYENNVTLLNFTVPEAYSSYYKYLDIVKSDKEKTQTVVSTKDETKFSYHLPYELSEGLSLLIQLVMKKDNNVFKSNIFSVVFNGSICATQYLETAYEDTIEYIMENKADFKDIEGLRNLLDVKLDKSTYYDYSNAQNEINNLKVDKVTGKGLSSNDYTDKEKQKLSSLPESAYSKGETELKLDLKADKTQFEDVEYEEVKGTLTKGVYASSKNGAFVENADYDMREVTLEAGYSYVISNVARNSIASAVFYDADHNYIGSDKIGTATTTQIREAVKIPDNAVYMCVTTYAYRSSEIKTPVVEKCKIVAYSNEIEKIKAYPKTADTLIWEEVEGTFETGFVRASDGALQSSQTNYLTLKVDVEKGYRYRVTTGIRTSGQAIVSFYNEADRFNGNLLHEGNDFTLYLNKEISEIHAGTTYMKISTNKDVLTEPKVERAKIENLSGLFNHTEKITTDLYNFSYLKGKKIVNFGDSIFGKFEPPFDISTKLSEITGATVYNCGLGGTQMSIHNTDYYTAFSMCKLADAIITDDFSLQDAALTDENWIPTERFKTNYNLIKSIDFNNVDIITLAYGTNDIADSDIDDESDNKNLKTFGGALRYTVEALLSAYPHLQIFICTPTYRFWMDDTYAFVEDSDTRTYSGHTLIDIVNKAKEVSKEYHIKCIDNYFELGFNKFTRTQYFPSNDGTHPNLNGRHLIAKHIAKELF